MKRFIFALTLAVSAPMASAGFVTGFNLNEWSEAMDRVNAGRPGQTDGISAGQFYGYVRGISDASYGVTFCLPDGTKLSQLIAITQQYVKAHPERWNETGSVLVMAALRPVHPCGK